LALAAGGLSAAAEAPEATTLRVPGKDRYHVILWCGDRVRRNQAHTNAIAAACRELGVTDLSLSPGDSPKPWLASGLGYYVENVVSPGLCLKFRSSVTDWNAFVTSWARERSPSAFVRDYSLSDPAWRAAAREQVRAAARLHAPFKPLFYDLRDELSTTVSANPFDYDFAPASLSAFRSWLRARYDSLGALNVAWGTAYGSWDAVAPFSTDEIKARMSGLADAQGRKPDWAAVRATRYAPEAARAKPERWRLAPWCDFRSFMDTCLAETLADLRQAARAADPATPVGIEGTQMPSAWGGYDFWKLSRALDWVEPYDIAAARAVFGSFMRGKPMLATYGESDPAAVSRRLWHLLLEGDCGAILWWSEDLFEGDGPALRLSAKGKAIAPAVREMHAPLARLLLRAERVEDPIAIHYSQTSIQLAWLFESFEDGATWQRRFSSFEATHSRHAALRAELWQRLREAGWLPQFLSYDEVAGGALARRGFKACFLPDSHALSAPEARALNDFAAQPGCRLLYTGEPGVFDASGSPRPAPLFAAGRQALAQLVGSLPAPATRLETPDSGVCLTRYRADGDSLFALEQRQRGQTGEDVTQSVSPAKSGETQRVVFIYNDARPLLDLRTGRTVGRGGRADVDVPYERPAILGFTPLPTN
jgi:hypothetical protein